MGNNFTYYMFLIMFDSYICYDYFYSVDSRYLRFNLDYDFRRLIMSDLEKVLLSTGMFLSLACVLFLIASVMKILGM